MKKLNAKGFTLIELLAVITIMGILMLVAIPAVARTIENTRRDTFMDTAKQYVSSVKTLWLSDGLVCKDDDTEKYPSQAVNGETYYIRINSKYVGKNQDDAGTPFGYYVPVLLEQGGKSSWANAEVTGYVKIVTTEEAAGAGRTKIVPNYYVAMIDTAKHGIPKTLSDGGTDDVLADDLKRRNVAVTNTDAGVDMPAAADKVYICEEA